MPSPTSSKNKSDLNARMELLERALLGEGESGLIGVVQAVRELKSAVETGFAHAEQSRLATAKEFYSKTEDQEKRLHEATKRVANVEGRLAENEKASAENRRETSSIKAQVDDFALTEKEIRTLRTIGKYFWALVSLILTAFGSAIYTHFFH